MWEPEAFLDEDAEPRYRSIGSSEPRYRSVGPGLLSDSDLVAAVRGEDACDGATQETVPFASPSISREGSQSEPSLFAPRECARPLWAPTPFVSRESSEDCAGLAVQRMESLSSRRSEDEAACADPSCGYASCGSADAEHSGRSTSGGATGGGGSAAGGSAAGVEVSEAMDELMALWRAMRVENSALAAQCREAEEGLNELSRANEQLETAARDGSLPAGTPSAAPDERKRLRSDAELLRGIDPSELHPRRRQSVTDTLPADLGVAELLARIRTERAARAAYEAQVRHHARVHMHAHLVQSARGVHFDAGGREHRGAPRAHGHESPAARTAGGAATGAGRAHRAGAAGAHRRRPRRVARADHGGPPCVHHHSCSREAARAHCKCASRIGNHRNRRYARGGVPSCRRSRDQQVMVAAGRRQAGSAGPATRQWQSRSDALLLPGETQTVLSPSHRRGSIESHSSFMLSRSRCARSHRAAPSPRCVTWRGVARQNSKVWRD